MLVFAATIFLGAFLLFQIEPLSARYILPWFGGSSAVWITCMLFFQLSLVAGYLYSHLLATRLAPRRQAVLHVAIVSACVLLMGGLAMVWQSPITPGPDWKPLDPDFPITRIFVLLLASIGLPFFILSTTGPLLQSWFAQTSAGASPYRLYALSNVGSLLALMTYPFVVEPALTLRAQAIGWSLMFVIFAAGVGLCGIAVTRVPKSIAPFDDAADLDASSSRFAVPTLAAGLQWLLLAAVASVMLLATTNEICQEVAVVPFLWVLPLAIYLLSFVICFDSDRWYRRAIFHPALAVAIFLSCVVLCRPPAQVSLQVLIYCGLLFAVCMVCHGELVKSKPDARHLTSFYLTIAVGGALGGVFAALIAPRIFTGYWEFHLSIWASALMLFFVVVGDPQSWIHERRPVTAIVLFAGALILPRLIGSNSIRSLAGSYQLAGMLAAIGLLAMLAYRSNSMLSRKRPALLVQAAVVSALIVVGGVLLTSVRANVINSSLSTRNFYGALSVLSRNNDDPATHNYVLHHGQIRHGTQYTAPDKRELPVSYYGHDSGLGLLMTHLPQRAASRPGDRSIRVGVIGLGVATIASYGEPGDYIRFYEINPADIEIASDPHGFFTYLRDSRARVDIVAGDARLSMEREVALGNPQKFDVLVIDAFAGDAIPVHLLTWEAFEIYLGELSANGVLAIHISNRYLDLRPVIRALAERFKLRSGWVHAPDAPLENQSDWVLLARDDQVLGQPALSSKLQSLDTQRRVRLWTDDYSNLFQILK